MSDLAVDVPDAGISTCLDPEATEFAAIAEYFRRLAVAAGKKFG
jgi:hypothetical protein